MKSIDDIYEILNQIPVTKANEPYIAEIKDLLVQEEYIKALEKMKQLKEVSNDETEDELEIEEDEEQKMEKIKEIIIGIRNIRNNMNVHPSKKSKLVFVTEEYKNVIENSKTFLEKLGFANEIIVQNDKAGIDSNAISILLDGIETYIPFEELVDLEAEKQRLQEEKQKLIYEVERCEKMLSNPGFVNKAPEAKVNAEKEKLEKYKAMLENTEERLKKL